MPEIERFDALILGGGSAGKKLGPHLAKAGQRVAVVERRWIGGSCPNVACLPSKNLIWSAKVADLVRRGAQFGLRTVPVSVDMSLVRQRKRDMVDRLVEASRDAYGDDVDLVMGEGKFTGPRAIAVSLDGGGERLLTGAKIFIDVGTRPTIPDVPGLRQACPLTHIEALDLGELPDHLIVLGGGYVGLELAQAFRRFGSRVTVVERGPQLASREDRDVAEEIRRLLVGEDVEVLLSTSVVCVSGSSGDSVAVRVRTSEGERTIQGSHILVAAGRTPNTAGVGLDLAGVRLDDRGFIAVNDKLETTAPDVWAMGECAGSPQFTHVVYDDFRVVRDNLAGGDRTTRDRVVPYCMFTDPPLARVGLSEADARSRGVAVRTFTLPMGAVLRARTLDETAGFMKALVAADSDRILGFTMIGADAGEIMSVVQMAMMAGLPYTALREAVIAHPTMAEGLGSLFSGTAKASAYDRQSVDVAEPSAQAA